MDTTSYTDADLNNFLTVATAKVTYAKAAMALLNDAHSDAIDACDTSGDDWIVNMVDACSDIVVRTNELAAHIARLERIEMAFFTAILDRRESRVTASHYANLKARGY